jgi:hypothetical protein
MAACFNVGGVKCALGSFADGEDVVHVGRGRRAIYAPGALGQDRQAEPPPGGRVIERMKGIGLALTLVHAPTLGDRGRMRGAPRRRAERHERGTRGHGATTEGTHSMISRPGALISIETVVLLAGINRFSAESLRCRPSVAQPRRRAGGSAGRWHHVPFPWCPQPQPTRGAGRDRLSAQLESCSRLGRSLGRETLFAGDRH